MKWSDCGEYFIIVKLDEFKKILPNYFKSSRYTSFLRQLNMYNFVRKASEKSPHAFQHTHFRKDQIEELRLIKRKQVKSNKNEKAMDEEEIKKELKEQIKIEASKKNKLEIEKWKLKEELENSQLCSFNNHKDNIIPIVQFINNIDPEVKLEPEIIPETVPMIKDIFLGKTDLNIEKRNTSITNKVSTLLKEKLERYKNINLISGSDIEIDERDAERIGEEGRPSSVSHPNYINSSCKSLNNILSPIVELKNSIDESFSPVIAGSFSNQRDQGRNFMFLSPLKELRHSNNQKDV